MGGWVENSTLVSSAWSPPGDKIVFSHTSLGSKKPQQIYTMSADGTAITRITYTNDTTFTPDWDQGSQRLARARSIGRSAKDRSDDRKRDGRDRERCIEAGMDDYGLVRSRCCGRTVRQ